MTILEDGPSRKGTNPAAPSPSDSSIAQAFRDYAHLWPLSWAVEFVDKRAREIDATTSAQAAPVGADSMLTQALTDPENQPSQWGTIPLSMLPARMDDSRDPFPIDAPDYEDGYAMGWNACLDRIATPAAAVGGGSQVDPYQAKMREILSKALDADISNDESLWVLVNRAANALYWRGKEIKELRAANVATPAAPVGGFVVVLSPDEINNLPERVRAYIASLETEADHAGTIRDNFMLREENKALRKHIETHDVSDLIREFIACDGDSFARGSVAIRIAGKLEKAESASPAAQPSPHTTEDDYQHFLAYSGLEHSPLLQYAYYHGADVGMEKPKDAAQSSAKDGVRESVTDSFASEVAMAVHLAGYQLVAASVVREIISAANKEATTAAGLVDGLLSDTVGNLRRMAADEFKGRNHDRLNVVIERLEAAIGREVSKP